jgi:hypothetical protein
MWKAALLESELAKARRARELVEENSRGLSEAVAGGVQEGVLVVV